MKRVVVVLSFVFLSGCQTAPQTNKLDNELSSLPGNKLVSSSDSELAVVIVELPEAGYYKFGSQGLLDIAINTAFGKGIANRLSSLNGFSFLTLQDEIVSKLKDKAINVVSYPEQIELKYKQVDNENDKINSNEPYDYSDKNENEVDVSDVVLATNASKVLLIQLVNFGASRQYYGFAPLGAPEDYALIQAFLVNADNSVEWQLAKFTGKNIESPVVGEWNQKPDYPNLIESSEKAIDTAKGYLIDSILKDVL